MFRADKVKPAGSWSGSPFDTIVLDHDARFRRRIVMKGVKGTPFVLDLTETTMLRNGDALALEDGRLIEVVAAPEPLVEIRAANPQDMLRIAWHLGNRHLPIAILPNKIRIRRDAVIEDMVRALGAKIIEIEAPFDPEGGAYEGHAAHEAHDHAAHDHATHEPHDHHHDHAGHDHDHAHHDHAHHDHHDHDHGAHHDHDHTDHHGHAHDHDHRRD